MTQPINVVSLYPQTAQAVRSSKWTYELVDNQSGVQHARFSFPETE